MAKGRKAQQQAAVEQRVVTERAGVERPQTQPRLELYLQPGYGPQPRARPARAPSQHRGALMVGAATMGLH